MAENKKLTREDCPELLDEIVNLIHEQILAMRAKKDLTPEDQRNIIAMGTFISSVYERYADELRILQKDLNGLSKADLMRLTKTEAKKAAK